MRETPGEDTRRIEPEGWEHVDVRRRNGCGI
jgi:hypothetical protein